MCLSAIVNLPPTTLQQNAINLKIFSTIVNISVGMLVDLNMVLPNGGFVNMGEVCQLGEFYFIIFFWIAVGLLFL